MVLNKRWIPAIIAPALIASFALTAPLQASAIDLPDLSANQVMLLMERGDKVKGFSGTLVKTTNLGLPNLELSNMVTEEMVAEMEENTPEGFKDMIPQITEQSMLTDAISLIAGTHKIRVYASEVGFRSQVLERMGQRDLIVNENEIWLYDFKKSLATTVDISMLKDIELDASTLSSLSESFDKQLAGAAAKLQLDLSDPSALVDAFLSDAEKVADISVGKDHKAAGRDAYQLIASPKSENSLIDSIRISIDAENGFVLDMKVYSTEEEEAVVHIGFENISFQVPEDSMFSFSPPTGVTVETLTFSEEDKKELTSAVEKAYPNLKEKYQGLTEQEIKTELKAAADKLPENYQTRFTSKYLIGTDWDTIVSLEAMPEEFPLELLNNPILSGLFETASSGTAFSTPLFNILIADDGRVFIGAVTLDYLEKVATR